MKLFIKLGIVLGVLITIVACQKDEFSPSASTAIDQVSVEIFNGADITNPDDNGGVSSPANGIAPQVPTSNGGEGSTSSPDSPFFDIALEDQMTADGDDNLSVLNGEVDEMHADRWDANVTINWVDEMPTGDQWTFVDTSIRGGRAVVGPTPDCPYEDCDTAIPAAVAQYQPIANELCQDIWICIACCIDDGIVYATLIIQHNCGIYPTTAEY